MTGEAPPDPLPLALDYARRGYPVFPIHTPGEGGLCTCGRAPCEDAQGLLYRRRGS